MQHGRQWADLCIFFKIGLFRVKEAASLAGSDIVRESTECELHIHKGSRVAYGPQFNIGVFWGEIKSNFVALTKRHSCFS